MNNFPTCSVIVPTYNRPKQLPALLQALTQLDYPHYEIIIVDDGSPTPVSVAPFQAGVKLLRQRNAGPAAARNAGAAVATGDLLLFTDDDCRPAPDWISAFVAQYVQSPDALLGGRVINGFPRNLFATATQDMIDYLRGEPARFFASNNMGIGRKRFLEIDGFSTDFPLAAGEDRDFSDRAHPLVYCPDAQVRHYHNLTLRRFCQQHANYGRGARVLSQKRTGRHLSSPNFYRDLLLYPIHQRGIHGVPSSALLLLAQAATAYGFFFR